MRIPRLIIVIALLAITACSEKSPEYAALPGSMRQPPGTMAQLVFYYPHSYFWSSFTSSIGVDGQGICGLKSGTYAIRNIAPEGHMAITASLCNSSGTSRMVINAEAGKKYYIRVLPNDQTVTGLIARHGLSGLRPLAEPVPTTSLSPTLAKPRGPVGIFWVDVIPEAAAFKELEGLTLCQECL